MNFILHRKNFQKKSSKITKKSKKLLVERYDEVSTRLLVTRLVILSNISFFIISIFTYPSFFKALHRPRGVRIGELEAKKTKICKFSWFRFLITICGKKNKENNKKIFGRLFWTDVHNLLVLQSWYVDMMLICFFWYKFFQI